MPTPRHRPGKGSIRLHEYTWLLGTGNTFTCRDPRSGAADQLPAECHASPAGGQTASARGIRGIRAALPNFAISRSRAVKAGLRLPVLELLPDGSYLSVVARLTLHDKARNTLIAAARAGEYLDPAQAMQVRVIEYEIGDRGGSGELIALITTITGPAAASAQELAAAYCQRWEEEAGNDQVKTHLRGPGSVLRSKSPDMVRQEIYGYLPTHYAISALICQAATRPASTPTGSSSCAPSGSPAAGPLARPFPLTRPADHSPRSWPASPARATSTAPGGTAPIPA